MLLRRNLWMFPLWEGEGAGGGEGAGDKGGEGGDKAAVSLREQLATTLPDTEREGFQKWASTYTDDTEFVRGAFNMRQQFDARVPVPGKDAKPEDYDKFFQKVGKPAAPKDYAFDWGKGEDGKPVQLPDSDAARFESFKEYAHQHHFTQGQFEAGIKFLNEDNAKQEAEFEAMLDREHENSLKAMKAEWGPDFEPNVQAALDGGLAYAPDEKAWTDFVNLPLAGGMLVGDHPTLLKTMAKVGRASAEDQRVRDLRSSGEAETIQAQIAAIENEAIKAGKSTSSEEYHNRLMPLYKKLEPKTFTGFSRG